MARSYGEVPVWWSSLMSRAAIYAGQKRIPPVVAAELADEYRTVTTALKPGIIEF